MRERVVLLEQQCWSNSHYSRSECLEISGFSESLKNEDLEGTAVTVCEEFELVVDPSNVEDCHWVATPYTQGVVSTLIRCRTMLYDVVSTLKQHLVSTGK